MAVAGVASAESAIEEYAVDDTASAPASRYGGFSFGYKFTVGNSDILVSQLGVMDELSDKFWEPLTVSLYKIDGTLVASIEVNQTDFSDSIGSYATPLGTNIFRMQEIEPVKLSAKTSYVLSAERSNDGGPDNDGVYDHSRIASFKAGEGIVIDEGRFGGARAIPEGVASKMPYIGPNMVFSIVR